MNDRGLEKPFAGPWAPGPAFPTLLPNQVHLWYSDLSELPLPKEGALPLNGGERRRAQRFRRSSDREEWIRSRYWLRSVLSRYSEFEPGEIEIRYGKNGKPTVEKIGRKLEFNLGHSGNQALVGISTAEIGVDIEQVGVVQLSDGLLKEAFTGSEIEALAAWDSTEQETPFLKGWTRKEALLKGTGEGLSRSPKSLTVLQKGCAGSGPLSFHVLESPAVYRGWTLWDLEPSPSTLGAIAVRAQNPTFQVWYWG